MKTFTFLLFFLAFYGSVVGQSYSFSQHQESYQDLTNDIMSPSSMKIVNKNYQAFGKAMSDTFYMLLNGAIFNVTPMSTFSFNPLLGDLQFDMAFSELSYKIDNQAGYDILKFQWKGLTSEDDPSVRIDLQVWIYEKDQMIEFRYGPGVITGDFGVGIAHTPDGASDPDQVLALSGDRNSPTVTASILDDLGGKPDSGTVFRFSLLPSGIDGSVNNSFSVYPNPGKGGFQLDADGVESARAFDSAGKEIAVSYDSGLYQLMEATPGICFLHFTMEDGSRVQERLVVQ